MHNGANANPTYLGHCHTMNSVILGQASVSRKSNTGDTAGACIPEMSEKVGNGY